MKKRMTDMKRRDFINAAALTAGGVMLGGASQLEAQQKGVAGAQGATTADSQTRMAQQGGEGRDPVQGAGIVG